MRPLSLTVSALLVGCLAAAPSHASVPRSIRTSLDAYVRTVTLPLPPRVSGVQDDPVPPACATEDAAFLAGVVQANKETDKAKTFGSSIVWPLTYVYGWALPGSDHVHQADIRGLTKASADYLRCYQEGYAYQDHINDERRKNTATIGGIIGYFLLYALFGIEANEATDSSDSGE